FLRWDVYYNLYRVDDVVGGYDDIYPFFPVYNNIFSGQHVGSPNDGYCYSFKQAAFNGYSWVVQSEQIWSDNGFGQNRIAGYNNGGKVYTYNPNTSSWGYTNLPAAATESNNGSFAFANELFIAEDRIYRINNWGFEQVLTLNPTYFRQEYAQSGGSYVYVHNSNLQSQGNVSYYYIDKTDNSVKTVVYNNLDENLFMSGSSNRRAQQFGGKYPSFSSGNLRGRKLIDNLMGQDIYDNVLSETITDDGSGNIVKIKYAYDDSHTSLNDVSVIYGTVTITQAGSDTGTTNGYEKKYFDNGLNDFTKAGLLLKKETYNTNGNKLAEVVNSYTKYAYNILNSASSTISINHTWRLTSVNESSYVGGPTTNNINYNYDTYGNITYTWKTNSMGLVESSTITYADVYYSFMASKNLRGFLYKKVNKVGDDIVSVEKNNWIQNGNVVYMSGNDSGTSESNLRTNNQIEVVDNYGNIVQTSNGLGVSNAVLMGYNYKYVVATVTNVSQQDLINTLDVSYATLQSYNNQQLKTELLKLYDFYPMIQISLYDNNGKIVQAIDARKNETNYVYDEFGRLSFVTDKNNKIITAKSYNYKN